MIEKAILRAGKIGKRRELITPLCNGWRAREAVRCKLSDTETKPSGFRRPNRAELRDRYTDDFRLHPEGTNDARAELCVRGCTDDTEPRATSIRSGDRSIPLTSQSIRSTGANGCNYSLRTAPFATARVPLGDADGTHTSDQNRKSESKTSDNGAFYSTKIGTESPSLVKPHRLFW
ncbi:hypothetical protein [Burkholderia ambifaria]|uniref:hypothetical protein n=1 Tax=Burkholderia ambifaria TaxID=152480 RepID=UPI0012FE4642|nr:hypothetical protein [Burkholderia ambifaria]